jgi:hypothetical protein
MLDDTLAGHSLHCPKCGFHLTSLLLCPECGIRFDGRCPIRVRMMIYEPPHDGFEDWDGNIETGWKEVWGHPYLARLYDYRLPRRMRFVLTMAPDREWANQYANEQVVRPLRQQQKQSLGVYSVRRVEVWYPNEQPDQAH